MVVMMTKKYKLKKEAPGHVVKVLHIILTVVYSQVVENCKVNNTDPLIFYCVTFTKFCLLVVGVHFTTVLYLSDVHDVTNKRK